MNYLEKYFKKKEKEKKKNNESAPSKKKISPPAIKNKKEKVGKIKERHLDCKNINNEYEAEKKETNDEYEQFKNEQEETRIKNLKQKRFEKIYSKEKLEGKALKISGKKNDIDRIFKRNCVIKYKNMNMYNYIIGKKNIPENSYKLIEIDKDGNCFYRCVSFYLYGTVKYHGEIRETISKICIENIEELSEFQEYVEIRKDKYISTRQYIYDI